MAQTTNREIAGTDAYATASDFEEIFTQDMSALYLLAVLLTGDGDRAEECFVAAIGESRKNRRVFKDWARSWVRRSVIQSAIRLIAPGQPYENGDRKPAVSRALHDLPLVLHAEVTAIVALRTLERFVFVMSVLERYSDQDCSILLGCTRRQVSEARTRALQQLKSLMIRENGVTNAGSALREGSGSVIELTLARYWGTQAWNRRLSHDAALFP